MTNQKYDNCSLNITSTQKYILMLQLLQLSVSTNNTIISAKILLHKKSPTFCTNIRQNVPPISSLQHSIYTVVCTRWDTGETTILAKILSWSTKCPQIGPCMYKYKPFLLAEWLSRYWLHICTALSRCYCYSKKHSFVQNASFLNDSISQKFGQKISHSS